MPVSYQLTLTAEQDNSGPYYVVTYTTGAYYVPVLAGSPAYLPNVGSTAIVQIPDAAASASYLAFNLNNGSGCELCDNDVILVITGSAPFVQCCTGSILSVVSTGSAVRITYNSGTGANCLICNYVTAQTSSDGFDWGGNKTGSCGVSQSIEFNLPTASCPSNTTYYRLFQTCEGTPLPSTTTTSTTTTTTTVGPTTTSTTTTTTTPTPTTSTTTTTTTGVPTTSTTTTTTTAPSTTTTTTTSTTTTTTTGATELLIYAKYITTQSPGDLQYSLNNGTPITIGPISTSSCDYLYTITGLQVGDDIEFTDDQTYAISGDTTVCPSGPGGFSCNYNYSVLVSGTQYAYISVIGNQAC